ncbi:pterin-4-alpha-carbinolamine dehydratase family protein [Usnea florida]
MRSHVITPLSVFQTRQVLPNFTTSKRISNISSMQPKLSEGQDESRVLAEAKALLENGWILDDEEVGVKKTYHFKTYTKALDFLCTVGVRSKSKNHHSVMTIKTGSVNVHWTTHQTRGLSQKDTFMANYCDEQASLIGTVNTTEAQKCGPPSSSNM